MTAQARTDTMVQVALVATSVVLASFISINLLHRAEPGTAVAVLFALVPVPFFALAFGLLMRLGCDSDEARLRIQLEALAFAFPVSMLFAITVQLLHKAGVAQGYDVGDLFIDMGLLYLGGLYFAWRKHR
jgi:hypothetical protein